MNLTFLGDSLDHWKGSLFSLLSEAKLISELTIDLMATDIEQWKEDDFESFSKLLGVSPAQIFKHKHRLDRERKLYFSELGSVPGDLFLDPDTGIATSDAREQSKYLFPDELHGLLKHHNGRVVSVYQYVSRQRTRDRIRKVIEVVANTDIHFGCCTYESPSVAMLFFSSNTERIRCIEDFFHSLLGRHTEKRVIQHFQ